VEGADRDTWMIVEQMINNETLTTGIQSRRLTILFTGKKIKKQEDVNRQRKHSEERRS